MVELAALGGAPYCHLVRDSETAVGDVDVPGRCGEERVRQASRSRSDCCNRLQADAVAAVAAAAGCSAAGGGRAAAVAGGRIPYSMLNRVHQEHESTGDESCRGARLDEEIFPR